MQVERRPEITRPPSEADLAEAAYQALRLPSTEESAAYGLAHYLGAVTLARNPAALDAVVNLWTLRVRAALHVARSKAPSDWNENAAYFLSWEDQKCDFLRFEEYLDEVRNLSRVHPTPLPYQPYVPYATNVVGRFKNSFNARRHTPDRRGYLRYLSEFAPERITSLLTKHLVVCLPEEDLKLNSYIFASPGAGKSELLKLLVHAHLRKPGKAALIIFDVASDFAKQLRFRDFAHDDRRLVYIDPYLDYNYTPTSNPFEINETFSQIEVERHVKDRLSAEIGVALEQMLTDQGSGLTDNMRMVLSFSIRALFDIPGATFEHMLKLMLDKEGETLRSECARRTTSKSAYEFFSSEEAIEQSKPSRDAIANRLRATFLKFDVFRHLTCGETTIRLEELIEKRKIIVFNLAKTDTTKPVALAFGHFILAMINAIGYRRARMSEPERTPTHVIIDEFQNFVTASVFETIEELRKFRIMQTFVQPTLFGRIDKKDDRKTFLNGVQGTRFFGKCDSSIAEWVAELAGGIDPEDVKELGQDKDRRGEFFVRTQGRPTFLLNISTQLLGTHRTLTEAEWEPLRKRQLERYYRRKQLESDRDKTQTFSASQAAPERDPEAQPHATGAASNASRATGDTERPHAQKTKEKKAKEKKAKRDPFADASAPRQPPPPEPD